MRIMSRTVAIIEDDIIVANDLTELLSEMHYTVLFQVHSVKDAIEHLKKYSPQLILMDIQLNDSIDGIHLAGILKSEYKIPVIFTTAFSDTKTLERVKTVAPFGYIVKPYTETNIRIAVELAFNRIESTEDADNAKESETCFINTVSGLVKININNILYISAYDYYCNIFTTESKILAKMTLKELLDLLHTNFFLRVHKSYAVNISKAIKIKNNEIYIGNDKIPIGRAYKEDVLSKLRIL